MFKAFSLVLCLLLAGCGGQSPVLPIGKTDLTREYNRGNGTNSSAAAAHGRETHFAYGAIVGTGGTNANGVGFLHTYEDGTSIATINLNILPTPANQHYIVWTAEGDTLYPMTSRGVLKSIVGDARHSLQFETKDDPKTTVSHVFVTIEPSATPDGPSLPPGHPIAEGTLKEVKPPGK